MSMQIRARNALTLFAAITLAAALLPGAAFAQDDSQTTTWRVQAHWPAASASYEDSLGRIKKVIEARTEGRVKLKLYPAGALVSAPQIFDAVGRGTIEMGTIASAYAQSQMELAGIASGLPFAFRNVWEAIYFYRNESINFEQMLRDEAAEHGIYWATDKLYPTELVVKKPIDSWEDFKGLKLRSNGALQTFLSNAGASASYIPGPELYTALSTGVVDGAHWGAAQGASSMGLYEVAKYHVKPAITAAAADVFLVNQEALNALSDKDAKTIRDALDEHFWIRTNEYLYLERLALTEAMENQDVKVTHLPPEVIDRLTATARKSWDKMGQRSDKAAEVIDQLEQMLARLGYIESS